MIQCLNIKVNQKGNKMSTSDATIQMIYPETRMVTPEWVISQAQDIAADSNGVYENPTTLEDAMYILQDEGACTFADGVDTDDYEHDGQPDEAQEWHDFDPDC
jgi:hypothetical protein